VARTVDTKHLRGPGMPAYPWADWMNGQTWELTKGVDFPGKARAFQSNLHHKSHALGKRVRTERRGEVVYVQAVRDE
jgi:hypothetical protein